MAASTVSISELNCAKVSFCCIAYLTYPVGIGGSSWVGHWWWPWEQLESWIIYSGNQGEICCLLCNPPQFCGKAWTKIKGYRFPTGKCLWTEFWSLWRVGLTNRREFINRTQQRKGLYLWIKLSVANYGVCVVHLAKTYTVNESEINRR